MVGTGQRLVARFGTMNCSAWWSNAAGVELKLSDESLSSSSRHVMPILRRSHAFATFIGGASGGFGAPSRWDRPAAARAT